MQHSPQPSVCQAVSEARELCRVPLRPRGGRFDVEKLASAPLREEYQKQVTEKAGDRESR